MQQCRTNAPYETKGEDLVESSQQRVFFFQEIEAFLCGKNDQQIVAHRICEMIVASLYTLLAFLANERDGLLEMTLNQLE